MVASQKVALTDRFLKALKPAPAGKRLTVWDAVQPHLGIRVTDRGQRSFIVVMRRAGETSPTRHFLGSYPGLSLADARLNAPKIISALMKGEDPKEQERQRLREAEIQRGMKFSMVAEDYIKRHVSKLKSQRSTTLTLKKELLGQRLHRSKVEGKWQDTWIDCPDARWRDYTITEITRRDVVALLEAIADGGSRYQARKVFAILSKLFKWAILRDAYGITTNPIANIKHTDILGSFKSRTRVLNDLELCRVWSAAKQTPYPFGPLVQMLLLTGQRLREISSASWSEIDGDTLIIPGTRMKGKINHSIPLTGASRDTLARVPQFNDEKKANDAFIFTTTGGRRPLGGFSKMKNRLDKLIKDKGDVPMAPWTLHDLRRTVRTRMSALGVLPHIAELVIGHKQVGIQAVYDLHTYDKEKRSALHLWETHLLKLVRQTNEHIDCSARSTTGEEQLIEA